MEVSPGYKQTEVGVIPEEWDVGVMAFAVEKLEAGTSVNSDKEETPDFDSYPCVLKTGAAAGGTLHPGECKKVARRDLSRLNLALRKDTILISRMNTVELVGESAYVKTDYPNLFVPDRLWMATIRPPVHPLWLSYVLTWQPVKSQISASATGTSGSMKNVSKPSIRAIRIAYPPLPEQRAIAAALSDVDALLGGLDRLIAKKRDLKQAAMQQLLTGQTRLPGFRGAWEVKRLGDHVTFLRNGVNSRAELRAEGRVKYLHYGDIHASANSFLSPQTLPSLPDAKAARLDRLQDGDVIFADASEDIAGVCKSVELSGTRATDVVAGLHTIAARFDKAILADGFKGFLQYCPSFAVHLRRLAAGTKVYATNRAHIASVDMRLPSVPEQTAIAAVLSDMDAELAALEARRHKTRDLKQAMMQELLTGRTRLING